ncbi:MAG: cytochrome c peroxidase [Pseudobdellovibrio sp.]
MKYFGFENILYILKPMKPIFTFIILLASSLNFANAQEPIQALPDIEISAADMKKVALGQKLFHETKLSANNTISCASCHNLQTSGADNKVGSIGINGLKGEINSPTVFNSRFNFKQFWNGRASNLDSQLDGPIENKKEMGSNWADVIKKLSQDASYVADFMNVYKQEPSRENIKDAIVAFEKTLTTTNSKFDKFLKGEKNILSQSEKNGYQKFKSYGCVACHQGVNIGGNMFQTMGVMGNYFKDRGQINEADFGLFNTTKKESDKFVFKVPSLRNVALTSPYFHDGSAKNLKQAVKVMAKYQLGRKIPESDVNEIADFLNTLTGDNPLTRKPASSLVVGQ